MSDELRLYKLMTEEDTAPFEFGWANDEVFIVFVQWTEVDNFMSDLKKIFGSSLFWDNDFMLVVKDGYVCIELNKILHEYLEISEVFDRDEYAL